MPLREPLETLSEELNRLATTGGKEEIATLEVVERTLALEEFEVAIDYAASGGYQPSHSGRELDLAGSWDRLFEERRRLIEDEIPDVDSWADGFNAIRSLCNDIYRAIDGALDYVESTGIEVADLVTNSRRIALRIELRQKYGI